MFLLRETRGEGRPLVEYRVAGDEEVLITNI